MGRGRGRGFTEHEALFYGMCRPEPHRAMAYPESHLPALLRELNTMSAGIGKSTSQVVTLTIASSGWSIFGCGTSFTLTFEGPS
jgi:hypothetical protein